MKHEFTIKPAFLKPNNYRYCYLHPTGENGLITGLVLLTPKNGEERPCFQITFSDGEVDYVPTSEVLNAIYKIHHNNKREDQ
jgi:hypothetical protein